MAARKKTTRPKTHSKKKPAKKPAKKAHARSGSASRRGDRSDDDVVYADVRREMHSALMRRLI